MLQHLLSNLHIYNFTSATADQTPHNIDKKNCHHNQHEYSKDSWHTIDKGFEVRTTVFEVNAEENNSA